MPVPQRVDFLVGSRGWASSPPKKGLLRMVQLFHHCQLAFYEQARCLFHKE
ncbi:hypothetical protein QUA11_29160 [Microcoleus sp. S13_D1]